MKWKALAWDDQPGKYMDKFVEQLGRKSFEVEVCSTVDDCYRRFSSAPGAWDCVILDVIDESDPESPVPDAGVRLAARLRECRPTIPIVFLTARLDEVYKSGITINEPVLVRPKSSQMPFMIIDTLRFVASCPRADRVFLISAVNPQTKKMRQALEAAVKQETPLGFGVTCIAIAPETATRHISEEIRYSMKECGAFIAICTADDQLLDGTFQPRQNVLLEVGMALGMPDGYRRLIVLQQWGETADTQARLPSDLGGVLTLQFEDEKVDIWDAVVRALVAKGIRGRGM